MDWKIMPSSGFGSSWFEEDEDFSQSQIGAVEFVDQSLNIFRHFKFGGGDQGIAGEDGGITQRKVGGIAVAFRIFEIGGVDRVDLQIIRAEIFEHQVHVDFFVAQRGQVVIRRVTDASDLDAHIAKCHGFANGVEG